MNGYTKLFADIVTSTIWSESSDCRVLWITMLALKDRFNVCRATVPALAKFVGITAEETETYLAKFQEPDKWSRSQEHEGRRIEPCEGGWLILNGEKYQDKLNAEDRREQVRAAVARYRAKRAAKQSKKPKIDRVVTKGLNDRPPAAYDERHKLGCACDDCVALGVTPGEGI